MKREELLKKLALTITGIEKPHPIIVGIDGIDGAGKTTLADALTQLKITKYLLYSLLAKAGKTEGKQPWPARKKSTTI